jgi:hypothetical protein
MRQSDLGIEDSVVEVGCCLSTSPKPFRELPIRATGTLVSWDQKKYLLTNWHVVTGRNPAPPHETSLPNRVEMLVFKTAFEGHEHIVPLYGADDIPRWLEFPDLITFESVPYRLDLVAIPLAEDQGERSARLDFDLGFKTDLFPNQEVVVIGYPYSRATAIWKTCHIAECVFQEPPYFLINGRTKSGMSGSPVYGVNIFTIDKRRAFLGIYSGRYRDREGGESLSNLDIGIVWKLNNLQKLFPPIPPERDAGYMLAEFLGGRGRKKSASTPPPKSAN